MNTAIVTLADTKHKIPLGEDTMDASIVDASAALTLGFQCDS